MMMMMSKICFCLHTEDKPIEMDNFVDLTTDNCVFL